MKAIIDTIKSHPVKILFTLGLAALAIYWGLLGLLLAFPIMKIWNID